MNLSIVIPSYNESKNLQTLIERIQQALLPIDITYEICFIDDSNDDTQYLLHTLSQEYPMVRYLHRENKRGLGSAVVEGFALSKGEYIIVMDADLQQPPELLPELVRELHSHADIVIPSRFLKGSSDGGLNLFRKMVSLVARSIGQVAIKRFRRITDCTSGYFALRRTVIQDVPLICLSWKVLMEVLMKGNYAVVKEIPYQFTARDVGESKMRLREQWRYLGHIAVLMWHSLDHRRS